MLVSRFSGKVPTPEVKTLGILTTYKMHQKMPTLETQNAHARGKMPTQEVRHSRQRQHQKPSAWACHQSEVDLIMPQACSAKMSLA